MKSHKTKTTPSNPIIGPPRDSEDAVGEPVKTLPAADQSQDDSANNSTSVTTTIIVTMLNIDDLKPNDWNPNRMSTEDREAFRDEVKLLKKLPKPIVVIKDEPGFKIIDGEQAWKAAKDGGLKQVPCEIVEIDAVEAMRQTFSRNLHGENDPVLLGRLFERMMKEGGLSNRELAKLLRISEGKVRYHLKFAKATGLRIKYAPEDADKTIAALTIKQVDAYLDLPAKKRNEWLDGGANLAAAASSVPARNAKSNTAVSASTEPAEPVDQQSGDLSITEDVETTENEVVSSPDEDVEPAAIIQIYDQAVIEELEDCWERANLPTRQKFIASALSDPAMQAVVRRMIKQGT